MKRTCVIALDEGTEITDNGHVYVFIETTKIGKHLFQSDSTRAILQLSDAEVERAFLEHRLTTLPKYHPTDPAWLKRNMSRSIRNQPKSYISETDRRLDYVTAIIGAGAPRQANRSWRPVIRRVAEQRAKTGIEKIPSWTTVRRWLNRYNRRGRDVRALIPGYNGRGRAPLQLSPSLEARIGREIRRFMDPSRPSMAAVIRRVQHTIRMAIQQEPGAAGWAVPSTNLVKRRIKALCPYAVAEGRYGKRHAERMFREVKPGEIARYRLEVVELDHTQADIMIFDDENRVYLGRPTICAAIDKRTRALVGIYIGFEPPGEYTLLQCIQNMLEPKHYMNKEFPGIKLPWRVYGKPTVLVLDNAMENHGETLRHVAAALNMDVRYAPVKCPQFKGTIERFLGTLMRNALAFLPGRTFSNVVEKGDFDPAKDACMTLRDFRRLIHMWIVSEYMPSFHTGVNGVPELLWQQEVEEMPIRITEINSKDLVRHFAHTKIRHVDRLGIRMKGLRFNSNELNQIARLPEEHRDVLVTMRHDNVGEITVTHPITHEEFRVVSRLVEPRGMSIYQHKRICEEMKRQGVKIMNDLTYLQGKEDYYAMIDEMLEDRPRTKKERNKLVRDLGGERVAQPTTSAFDLDVDDDMFSPSEPDGAGDSDIAYLPSADDYDATVVD